uniref:Uncharacterized protein n=1 Tax=Ixodes scapularis TaxID=6945 RepID=A0A4D5RVD7_IXOSC
MGRRAPRRAATLPLARLVARTRAQPDPSHRVRAPTGPAPREPVARTRPRGGGLRAPPPGLLLHSRHPGPDPGGTRPCLCGRVTAGCAAPRQYLGAIWPAEAPGPTAVAPVPLEAASWRAQRLCLRPLGGPLAQLGASVVTYCTPYL